MRAPLAALAAALAAVLLMPAPATPGASLQLPPARTLPRSATSHAVVLVMENQSYYDVMNSSSSTYVRSLAKRGAVPSHMYGVRHPSLPNYLAMTGGDTFGIDSDCTSCHVSARNLVDQLEAGGFSWRAYMEGVSKPCDKSAEHGDYAKKHDPFMYYDDLRGNPTRCRSVVSFKRLERDLKKGRLPDYAFITPNLCNDTHDCSIGTGDGFLRHLVPALKHELGPHGILFVTWDEGTSDKGCCGTSSGGRIPTLVVGPDVKHGAHGSGSYTHYSTLRTIEEGFGLPLLRHAGDASTQSLGALLKRSTHGLLGRAAR